MGKNGQTYIRRFWKQLSERDGTQCHYCGVQLIPHGTARKHPKYYSIAGYDINTGELFYDPSDGYAYPSVDHIELRRDGGTDDLDNLVLACHECNSQRNVKPYAEFLALKRGAV